MKGQEQMMRECRLMQNDTEEKKRCMHMMTPNLWRLTHVCPLSSDWPAATSDHQ